MGLPMVKFPVRRFYTARTSEIFDYDDIYIAHKSEKKSRSSTSNLYNRMLYFSHYQNTQLSFIA